MIKPHPFEPGDMFGACLVCGMDEDVRTGECEHDPAHPCTECPPMHVPSGTWYEDEGRGGDAHV